MNKRLKKIREGRGVSQREVANAIGITISGYSNYEQGIREPSIEIIIKLCKFFNVSADYLLGLKDFE
ncbi:MAG: helix-turn-helix transcriptional regulator [Clostridia bacterium]|nr:helix-turn-helix transcriptional regulator [Clostridia bacterium]